MNKEDLVALYQDDRVVGLVDAKTSESFFAPGTQVGACLLALINALNDAQQKNTIVKKPIASLTQEPKELDSSEADG